jgi:hypothetical protein
MKAGQWKKLVAPFILNENEINAIMKIVDWSVK